MHFRNGPFQLIPRCHGHVRVLTTASNPRENQIFKLADGRDLAFAEFGVAHGKPLLYFHGYPSCRLEPKTIDPIAQRQGIRLIAIDRPGFGMSSPQRGRCMLDWTRDVKQFVQGVGLDKFAVMGLSGGGPYALATAYALPREMLTSVGLFASGPHWATGSKHMSLVRRVTRQMAIYWPSGLEMTLNVVVGGALWLLRKQWIKRIIDSKLGAIRDARKQASRATVPASDEVRDQPSIPSQVDELAHTLLAEPFAQGAKAAVEEAKILSDPDWGFRLENVAYTNIKIWHGVRDGNAPITMMRTLADKLPSCTLYESDDTHYTMGRHIEAAFEEIVHNSNGSMPIQA